MYTQEFLDSAFTADYMHNIIVVLIPLFPFFYRGFRSTALRHRNRPASLGRRGKGASSSLYNIAALFRGTLRS